MKLRVAALALALTLAPNSYAERRPDVVTEHSIAAVINSSDFTSDTRGIHFYFGNAGTGGRRLVTNVTTRRSAPLFHRSAEEGCQRAMLSALWALRDRALREGGHAVTRIRSNWQNMETSSRTTYRCATAGTATVMLKADIVR
jgi:hypothetical protein